MSIKKTKDSITPSLSRIQRNLAQVPTRAYNYFVSVTPKDTGNARRKTTLKGNTIEANYPYAQRLDKGWSKQAPRGMVQPTIRFIQRLIRQIVRK
jgi:hypothetical protein